MKTARLKNIVITILALLNIFLLILLLSLHAQKWNAYKRSITQLSLLYENNNVSLDPSLLPDNTILSLPELVRDYTAEQSFAESLLGSVTSVDSGGGIYRYYNAASPANGNCLFRSNGAVYATVVHEVEDPLRFCSSVCSPFGYTQYTDLSDGLSRTITATRTIDDLIVYNCTITFTFSSNTLTSVSGFFIPAVPTESDSVSLDPITALVRFLDYRNSSGLICTQIVDISCGYLMQSTASSPLRVDPVIRIATDVNSYYVNTAGKVLRETSASPSVSGALEKS